MFEKQRSPAWGTVYQYSTLQWTLRISSVRHLVKTYYIIAPKESCKALVKACKGEPNPYALAKPVYAAFRLLLSLYFISIGNELLQ